MSARKVVIALLAAAATQGWATIDHHDWHERPAHPPLRAYHVVIDAAHLSEACRDDRRLMGCAVRMVKDDVCVIYTPPRPAAWVMEHERRHCAGYDHS